MRTLTLEEAQSRLTDLVRGLMPGDEVVIFENHRPVAKLIAPRQDESRPMFGRGQGVLTIVSEDDEHLKDWDAYMP